MASGALGPPSHTARKVGSLRFACHPGLILFGGSIVVRHFVARRPDERGQGLAEYALILALIAVIAIAALVFLGTSVSGILSRVGMAV